MEMTNASIAIKGNHESDCAEVKRTNECTV